MKIAITSQLPNLNSPVDEHFGRAPYFCIIHVEEGTLTGINNEDGVNAAQGAGIHAAQRLVDHGVQALITGHVGPKAWAAIEAAKIRVFSATEGTVEEALAAWRGNKLPELTRGMQK
jgi:predicted Fe-Mo cluster-binding NifX family protein